MREKPSQFHRYRNLFLTLKNPGRYLLHKLGFLKEDPLSFTLKGGLKVQVPLVQLNEFKCILMDDCYFKGFRKDFLVAEQKQTILDIGANLGFFSLYAKSRYPQSCIISIEPVEQNYQWLLANIKANDSCQHVTRKLALSDHQGEIELISAVDEPFPTGGSIFAKATESGSAAVSYKVSTLTLADLLQEEKVERVDFLKCDCEGAEYSIFYSCQAKILKCIQNLAMEVHTGNGEDENIDSMAAYLTNQGYACCVSSDRHFIWASRIRNNLLEPAP